MDTLTTKKTNKNRWQRRRNPAPLAKGLANHLDILAVIAPFQRVHTSRVKELLPHRSGDRIVRRLSHLHDHGYLNRTEMENRNYLLENEHWLTEKGRELLREHGRFPSTIVAKPKGEYRRLAVHTMMINNLLASIYAGAGSRFVPLPHKRLPLPYEISYTFPSRGLQSRKSTLRPDAIFGIRHGELINYYIVECENTSPVRPDWGGLERSSFLRKALAYGSILFDKKDFKELLGIRKVRVLVTGSTLEVVEHKMDVIRELYGDSDAFIFGVMPENGDAGNMFTTLYSRVGNPPFSLDLGV